MQFDKELIAVILSTVITAALLCFTLILLDWLIVSGYVVKNTLPAGKPGTIDIAVSCLIMVSTVVGCQRAIMNMINSETKSKKVKG
ncbi:hypothetical protein [Acinetobacter sp. YH16053]|uniref:hypothetical protein n=1 Tax=Acinetobacter sp. YH16053 TaxID=2601192 RepID=UPI0015D2EC4D|nr:hypothetical protein [Acinetobacter sp. YH16053]